MSSLLINPIRVVFVPFEMKNKKLVKRDDLPRFQDAEEIHLFLKRNPRVNSRAGVPVQLQWIEHDEAWAKAEYHKGLGNWNS